MRTHQDFRRRNARRRLIPRQHVIDLDSVLDCVLHMRAEDLLASLPDNSIDMWLTSPPYDNLRSYNGFVWNFEKIARESYRVLKPGGVGVWVVGDATIKGSETLSSFRQALYFRDVVGFNMHDTMIYHKNSSVFNSHHPRYLDGFEYMFVLAKGHVKTWNAQLKRNVNVGQLSGGTKRQRNGELKVFHNIRKPTPEFSIHDNVWRFYSGYGHNDKLASEHPAFFPEKLAERHILTWTNPGDIILDFFGGSGTTAKMARQYNRRFITCDISGEYVALMQRRLASAYTPDMFSIR